MVPAIILRITDVNIDDLHASSADVIPPQRGFDPLLTRKVRTIVTGFNSGQI